MNIDIIGAALPEFLDELQRYQGNLLLANRPELKGLKHFPNVSDTVANAYSQLRKGRKAVQDIETFARQGWSSPEDLPQALAFMRTHFPGVEERAQAHDRFVEMGYTSLGHWMQEKLGVSVMFAWEGEQAEHLCGGTLRALAPLPNADVLHPLLVSALPPSVALVLHKSGTYTVLHSSLNSPETTTELAQARNRALELACEPALT